MTHARTPTTPRGQNLVLFALTLFLLTLFVTMTLGIASRIRENHELETLADVSAYSNAVVNARAYNDIAIINRLQVSYYVAMTADESLISWTGYARGLMNAAEQGLAFLASGPPGGDGCKWNNDEASNAAGKLASLRPTLINGSWLADDIAAGQEAIGIQGKIAGLRYETREDPTFPGGMMRRAREERVQQTISQQIVNNAGLLPGVVSVITGPTPTSTNQGPQAVSRRELGCKDIVAPDPDGAGRGTGGSTMGGPGTGLCGRPTWNENLLNAAMGTRGDAFTRVRGVTPSGVVAIFAAVTAFENNVTFTPVAPTGSGYFGIAMDHSANPYPPVNAWADDHGSLTVTAADSGGKCSASTMIPVTADVKSTHLMEFTDEHVWSPADTAVADVPDTNHTMGDCANSCPSVWVQATMFLPNPTISGGDSPDAYGQPKNYAALERNYAHPAMNRPWELDFRFFFSTTSTGTRYDNRGEELHSAFAGQNIDKAVALATGMTYYHRKGNLIRKYWLEYPNLLNPFWRATLVAADVDRDPLAPSAAWQDIVDVKTSLYKPEYKWQRDTYEKMVVVGGFKGLH